MANCEKEGEVSLQELQKSLVEWADEKNLLFSTEEEIKKPALKK
jgi:hypothetical protein